MMKSDKWLIVPMEIIERELNGNLLLCMEALSRGWNCIIGTKKEIFENIQNLPEGVIFLKSITSNEIHNIKMLKSHGNKNASLDVEGLVYVSLEEFVRSRFTEATMAEVDCLFFWGETQRNAVAEAYPAHEHKLNTVGHPIADIWRERKLDIIHQDRIAELKERYGKYILIPSVFAVPNHHMGKNGNLNIMLKDRMIDNDEETIRYFENYERYLDYIFIDFIKIIPNLSKSFPDHKIVVRPHPSESHQLWIELSEKLDNVEVVFDGPITPWVIGAEAVLHWGCTTGIEAHLIGKEVISYNPLNPPLTQEDEDTYDHWLSHIVSDKCRTEDEVIQKLTQALDKKSSTKAKKSPKDINDWIYQSEEDRSAYLLFKELEKIGFNADRAIDVQSTKTMSVKEIIWQIIEVLHKVPGMRNLFPNRVQFGLSYRAYGRHKTRELTQEQLHKTLDILKVIYSDAFFKISKLSHNLFKLEADRKENE